MSQVSAQSYKKALSTIKLDILTMHPLIQYANLDALFINTGNNYLVNLVSVGFRRILSDFLIKFVDVPVEDDGFVFGLLEWLEKGLVDDCLPVLKVNLYLKIENHFLIFRISLMLRMRRKLMTYSYRLRTHLKIFGIICSMR